MRTDEKELPIFPNLRRAVRAGCLVVALCAVAGRVAAQPCTDAQSCDDGDASTLDACTPAGCTHTPVRCAPEAAIQDLIVEPLRAEDALLETIVARDLGGPGLATRLRRLIAGARRPLESLHCCGTPGSVRAGDVPSFNRCARLVSLRVRRACRRILAFVRLVEDAFRDGRIGPNTRAKVLANLPACRLRVIDAFPAPR